MLISGLEFDFDVSVDSIQLQTDTSKSNLMFGTFSDKFSGPFYVIRQSALSLPIRC